MPLGGVESCCIALHVPGIDPVVRAIWEQFVIPLSGVRFGRRGGGSPPDGLASRQLNSLCLIDGERVPRGGLAGRGG